MTRADNKVLFVTNSLRGGGAERSVNLILREIYPQTNSVGLCTINWSAPDQVSPSCEIFELGRRWKSGPLGTLIAFIKFTSLCLRLKPQTLVLNCELPELFGALLPLPVKFVIVEHTSRPWNGRKLLGYFARLILKFRKAAWVTVNRELDPWPKFIKYDQEILNPVTPALAPKPFSTSVDKEIFLFFVGRLSKEKRAQQFLDIVAHLRLPALVIGDGPELENLQRKADSLGIKIEFTGYLENPWEKIASRRGVLVSTSVYEGDGLVVLEALQNGIPVLVSDLPAFRRFLLPDYSYCDSLDKYESGIDYLVSKNLNLNDFKKSIDKLATERAPFLIAKQWLAFLRI
jgi:glycosyltransferase involved in cell wall biosynthesis